jgi:hypothetical protein
LNPKKGRRKKPQRGSATRVTPRESNFKGAEKPQGSRNCGGGKAEPPNKRLERGARSQIPQRETEGQERVPRRSEGETERRARRGASWRKLRG